MARVAERPLDPDRRLVLGAIASLVGVACGPKVATSTPDAPLSAAQVLVVVPPGVLVLGREYLEAEPKEADADRLREALAWPSTEDDAAWRASLGEAIRDDLDEDRIVELAGWHLTRTECRVYALAALLEEGA